MHIQRGEWWIQQPKGGQGVQFRSLAVKAVRESSKERTMRKIAMIIRRAMNVDQIPCSACGTYNSENAKVCQGCGTRIG